MKHQRIFIFSLVMLVLIAMTACVQASQNDEPLEVVPQQAETAPVILEANDTQSDSELFAANPELMAADRFTGAIEEETMSASTFYATNPELMATQRYAVEAEESTLDAFLRANPELRFVRRSLETAPAQKQSALDAFLEANPELRFARRSLEATFSE